MSRPAFVKLTSVVCSGLILFVVGLAPQKIAAQQLLPFNGFDVAMGLIELADIYYGIPDRDGIPAIDEPRFLAGAARDGQLAKNARVLAVNHNGVAKAYPIAILDQHEIVNDQFAGKPLLITFCPLCGTGMVFTADVGGKTLSFGVSGLLYNSDVLLYDRNTESLWSQVMKTAVTGPLKGTKLVQVPAQYTTWGRWLEQYPDSLLLSQETGYSRDYGADVYHDYKRLPVVMFPTTHQDFRLPAKTWVLGLTVGAAALALPFEQLDKLDIPLTVEVGGASLQVRWDRQSSSAVVVDAQGSEVPATAGYWFAWVAFHPKTALYLQQP